MARRTRSHFALEVKRLVAKAKWERQLALPVLDEESGKLLEHKQLRCHPKLGGIWDFLCK